MPFASVPEQKVVAALHDASNVACYSWHTLYRLRQLKQVYKHLATDPRQKKMSSLRKTVWACIWFLISFAAILNEHVNEQTNGRDPIFVARTKWETKLRSYVLTIRFKSCMMQSCMMPNVLRASCAPWVAVTCERRLHVFDWCDVRHEAMTTSSCDSAPSPCI